MELETRNRVVVELVQNGFTITVEIYDESPEPTVEVFVASSLVAAKAIINKQISRIRP
jgi:hypothetical protein